jgi:hypothetical protein
VMDGNAKVQVEVACLVPARALRGCGPQNPVSALNSNASSLPPLQCDHFVTHYLHPAKSRLYFAIFLKMLNFSYLISYF